MGCNGVVNGMSHRHRLDSSHCNAHLHYRVEDSIKLIAEGLAKYGVNNVAVAFNGGKDCTVLLHLMLMALSRRDPGGAKDKITAVCIDTGEAFPEVEMFTEHCVHRYNLDMIRLRGDMRTGLFDLKKRLPNIRAIFTGTRLTDPHSAHLQIFTPCDEGWPDLMRVNPILTWNYGQVWEFIRELEVDYCSLYDQGYTSLGNINNTRKNPALFCEETNSFKPAYLLSEQNLERAGRT